MYDQYVAVVIIAAALTTLTVATVREAMPPTWEVFAADGVPIKVTRTRTAARWHARHRGLDYERAGEGWIPTTSSRPVVLTRGRRDAA